MQINLDERGESPDQNPQRVQVPFLNQPVGAGDVVARMHEDQRYRHGSIVGPNF